MSYTPLDSGFVSSTLLKEGPDVVAVWMLLLATADKLGESSMQPGTAASLLRIADQRAEAAFAILAKPDPKSRNKDQDGRRIVPSGDGGWVIVSHQKYQSLASRAAATERQRRYAARVKEREEQRAGKQGTCDEPGCLQPQELAVSGQMVCTAHAFAASSREPGQEG